MIALVRLAAAATADVVVVAAVVVFVVPRMDLWVSSHRYYFESEMEKSMTAAAAADVVGVPQMDLWVLLLLSPPLQ